MLQLMALWKRVGVRVIYRMWNKNHSDIGVTWKCPHLQKKTELLFSTYRLMNHEQLIFSNHCNILCHILSSQVSAVDYRSNHFSYFVSAASTFAGLNTGWISERKKRTFTWIVALTNTAKELTMNFIQQCVLFLSHTKTTNSFKTEQREK